MTNLWIGIGVLTFLGALAILFPLLKAKIAGAQASEVLNRKEQNIAIFEDRLAELDAEFELGNLSQADYDQLVLELKKSLLSDAQGLEDDVAVPATSGVGAATWIASMGVCAVFALTSLFLYQQYGRADDLRTSLTVPAPGQMSLQEALAQLEQELTERPENPEGWYMLATTYTSMGRFEQGLVAFERVLELLTPEDEPYSKVMGEFTQALFLSKGNQVDAQVREQLGKTLELDPNDVNALSIKGVDAFAQGEYAQAIEHWQQALRFAQGESAQSLENALEMAKARLQGDQPNNAAMAAAPEQSAQPAEATQSSDAVVAAKIDVAVSLSPELAARAKPTDTVFIFARPVGGRMPLAAVRLQVADLPVTLTLDASTAMSPQMTLDTVDVAEVTARISFSGQPTPQTGDLFGTLPEVKTREDLNTKQLVIDRVVD
ncbi:MAG: c-type cytochrome biogenesis protein CcmI [Pontibacterium sp.]